MSDTHHENDLTPHCTTCQAQSCQSRNVVATEIMYRNILAAGHPDSFHEVEIAEGKFYILDHTFNPDGSINEKGVCQYLQDNKCSLGYAKPGTCAVWPATRKINKFGEYQGIAIAQSCDAEKAKAETPDFMNRAQFLIGLLNENMPIAVTQKAIEKHRSNLVEKRKNLLTG